MKRLAISLIMMGLFLGQAFAADQNLTDKTADSSPTGDDLIYVVNDPSGSAGDRKVTIANLFANAPVDSITTDMLKDIDTPSDEECATYESTGNTIEWQACGGIGNEDNITEGDTVVEVIDTGSDGNITFDVDGTQVVTINNSGNVGINETSPAQALDIDGIGQMNTLYLENASTNIDNSANSIRFKSSVGHNFVNSGSISRVYIDSSTGYVGIGSTTPQGLLDVVGGQIIADNGTAAAPSIVVGGGLGTGFYAPIDNQIDISISGAKKWAITGNDIKTNASGRIYAGNGSSSIPSFVSVFDANTGMYYPSAADNLSLVTGGADRLNIDASGNIGVGSSSPEDTVVIYQTDDLKGLTLYGYDDVEASSVKTYMDSSGNAEIISTGNMSIKSNSVSAIDINTGNVGVGTTVPSAELHVGTGVEDSIDGTDDLYVADDLEVDGTLYLSDGTALVDSGDLGSGSSKWTDGGSTTYFTSSDNVGIGTTIADTKLHVVGDTTMDGDLIIKNLADDSGFALNVNDGDKEFTICADDSDGDKFKISTTACGTNDRIVIDSSGNVGIGSSSPGAPLVIEGSTANNTPLMEFHQNGDSGEFFTGYNDLGNQVMYFNQSTSGSAIFIMNDASGDKAIDVLAESGYLGVDAFDSGVGTVKVDGTSGGCIMLRDTDDAGWTKSTALNGVVTDATDADGDC